MNSPDTDPSPPMTVKEILCASAREQIEAAIDQLDMHRLENAQWTLMTAIEIIAEARRQ